MSLQVAITEEARCNISDNADWWAEHRSVDQARRWKEEVKLPISDYPNRHLGARTRERTFVRSSKSNFETNW